ncbi:MAG: MarR family transcriptional regulator [Deltaproteobacteria bacterium]|nr:MarR family transcriptional regulator [Deltaproteobacteria bacterium]
MIDLINQCKAYLLKTLGARVSLSALEKTSGLPFFLHDHYAFYTLKLLNEEFIAVAAKSHGELTPAAIRKHMTHVNNKLDLQPVFLCETLTASNRKRLIEYKIPFIIPDNQLYLPDMAIDLREHFIKARSKPMVFGPATQAVLLYIIAQKVTGPVTPKKLAAKLGYSKMSMSRSIGLIEAAKLGETEIDGKNRLVHFDKDSRDLWGKALPYLKTPIKKIGWLKSVNDTAPFHKAGESALAHFSMLTPPKQPVYAIGFNHWKQIKDRLDISKFPDEAACKLEIWSYAPAILAKDNVNIVDPFSLYLSLKDMTDERIESALEEMLGAIEW